MPGAISWITCGIKKGVKAHNTAKGLDSLIEAVQGYSLRVNLTPTGVTPSDQNAPNNFNAYVTTYQTLYAQGIDLVRDSAIYSPILAKKGADIYKRLGNKMLVLLDFSRGVGGLIAPNGTLQGFPMQHPLAGIAYNAFFTPQPPQNVTRV